MPRLTIDHVHHPHIAAEGIRRRPHARATSDSLARIRAGQIAQRTLDVLSIVAEFGPANLHHLAIQHAANRTNKLDQLEQLGVATTFRPVKGPTYVAIPGRSFIAATSALEYRHVAETGREMQPGRARVAPQSVGRGFALNTIVARLGQAAGDALLRMRGSHSIGAPAGGIAIERWTRRQGQSPELVASCYVVPILSETVSEARLILAWMKHLTSGGLVTPIVFVVADHSLSPGRIVTLVQRIADQNDEVLGDIAAAVLERRGRPMWTAADMLHLRDRTRSYVHQVCAVAAWGDWFPTPFWRSKRLHGLPGRRVANLTPLAALAPREGAVQLVNEVEWTATERWAIAGYRELSL